MEYLQHQKGCKFMSLAGICTCSPTEESTSTPPPRTGYTYNSRGARLLRSVTKGQRVVWSPKTGWQDK